MTLTQWLRSRLAPRPAPARRRPHPRPAVEVLEDRRTPSTGGALDPPFGSGGQVGWRHRIVGRSRQRPARRLLAGSPDVPWRLSSAAACRAQ